MNTLNQIQIGGYLVGQYRQAKAARKESELQYHLIVINAFREVSDALVSRQELVESRQYQTGEVTALEPQSPNCPPHLKRHPLCITI